MQTAANTSLVLTDFSSFKRFADFETEISCGELYQEVALGLLRGVHLKQNFHQTGDRLVLLAEHAHAFRKMDVLEQVSQILVRLPLPREYQAIGRYYQAVCVQRFGRGDVKLAVRLLEFVADSAPAKYRIRAMISLAASSRSQCDNRSALSRYCEAARFARHSKVYDPYASLGTQKMIAVINGEDGNHRGALALLENLLPLASSVRQLQPHVYYDYMNSLAVELCEVRRLEEAENVSRIVLASPFARAYPEWRETLEEIELRGRRPSRTTVAFSRRSLEPKNLVAFGRRSLEPKNLVRMPVPERCDSLAVEPTPGTQPANVISLQEWKNKMPKQSNGDPQDSTTPRPGTDEEKRARLLELEKLTVRQKLLRIMEMLGDEGVTDKQLLRALMILEDVEPNENQGS